MNDTAPSYALLRLLYLGRASVVERLTREDCAALKVDTPLFHFLERVRVGEEWRHVFLTGNAGDGKTFTAQLALEGAPPDLHVVHDASGIYQSGRDPIDALRASLEDALGRGRRLVVAINRGQLERLGDQLHGQHSQLATIVAEARARLTLRSTWDSKPSPVVVVDMGLLDTLGEVIVSAALERAQTAQPTPGMSEASLSAFEAARAALRAPHVQLRIMRLFSAMRAEGKHVTMRQLWAYLAYLMTGGRAPDDPSAPDLGDSLGARIFDERAQGALFDLARAVGDPAREPAPALIEALLGGALGPNEASVYPGLGFLHNRQEVALDGLPALRALSVHASDKPARAPQRPPFGTVLSALRDHKETWWRGGSVIEELIDGIHRGLDLPYTPGVRWVWRRLCYDATRWDQAPLLSNAKLDTASLALGLPLPAPETRAALGDAWQPPFLWLAYIHEGEPITTRLTPSLLNRLLLSSEHHPAELTDSERHLLWSWLARVQGSAQRDEVLVASATGEVSARLFKNALKPKTQYKRR